MVDLTELDKLLSEIERLWPAPGQLPSREIVQLCKDAVTRYPESSSLWYDLGIIMQRCAGEYGFSPDDYLRCYENSVRLDPANAEAYQELGYVLNVYFDENERARQAFERAVALGAGHESYLGRARSLAEMGKTDEAVESLSLDMCPFHDHPEIRVLRSEILDGDWSA